VRQAAVGVGDRIEIEKARTRNPRRGM